MKVNEICISNASATAEYVQDILVMMLLPDFALVLTTRRGGNKK